MLIFQRLLSWSILILSVISIFTKFLISNYCLAFILLRASTLPPFWLPSKYCTTVLISWELFCFCTIKSVFFSSEIFPSEYLFILPYHFSRKPSFGFWVSTVSIPDNLSILIFSIQTPLSLWYFSFLWCFF